MDIVLRGLRNNVNELEMQALKISGVYKRYLH